MWFGLWFPIMSKPLAWAYEARGWQQHSVRSAQVVKWNDGFIRVHEILWRVLLTFLLYTMVGLFKAALGKYMSFHFHHRNHSAKMQVRCSLQDTDRGALYRNTCAVASTSLHRTCTLATARHDHRDSLISVNRDLPMKRNSASVTSVECERWMMMCRKHSCTKT